jgi:hypothetical protein
MSCGLKTLALLQYNVAKPYEVTAELLQDPELEIYGIIAIQEPYLNRRTTLVSTQNPRKDAFFTVLPHHRKPMVAFYVNRRIDIKTVQVPEMGPNVCSIHITCRAGEEKNEVSTHNIYHPCPASSPPIVGGPYEGAEYLQ